MPCCCQHLGFVFFHHIFLLLFLIYSCEGQIQVAGPSQPVTVTVGDDVILPCHLQPASDATGLTFEWARTDMNPRFVHVWHEGKDLNVKQHSSFKGRTSLDISKIKNGDISLKLSKVKLSDKGLYRCYIPDFDKHSTVQLVVGSASLPVVIFAGIDQSVSEVVLQCESAGWYPEPDLLWLDIEENLVSTGPTVKVKRSDDLYTVSSRITVEKRHGNNFTCRVQQKNINQTRETRIHVSDGLFVAPCSFAARIAISLAACIMSVLVVISAVWIGSRNNIKTNMIQQQENIHLKEENQKMVGTLKQTEEMLTNKEEEHHKMEMLLRKHKGELENQKERLKLQHKKLVDLLENNRKELKSAEKSNLLNLIKISTDFNWNLKGIEKAFDELILSTEKLMHSTETVNVQTVEKKET